jgi:pyruvate dehydrogenase E2 component (dihydrolipoamide acetyltransferase)
MEFKLPELGENIKSADITNVLVHEGDVIAANDSVVELETEKAVVELPCPHAGRISKILVKKGDSVEVGQPLLIIEPEAETASPGSPAAMSGATAGSSSSAAAGATGSASEGAASSPSSVEPPSGATAGLPSSGSASPVAAGVLPAGPEVRRLARELGIDLRQVQGTGPRGRITPDDLRVAGAKEETLLGKPAVAPTASMPAPVVPPGEPGQDAFGPIRRERMSKIRQTIAAQMARSASTIPHVTNFDDADVTDLEAIRKGIPAGYLGANVKLTAMPFVAKAVARALRSHPVLNASLDEENQQVVYKEYVNLGVAVDTPRGLVVPVVRNVDRMSIGEIARALAALTERARAAQFALEELRGGTFTISNLGAVGGSYSTPIINHPEVAVLLLGRSRWMPVVREGKIEIRLMLPLSLSYDHRLVDGAAASRFLNQVIDDLQSPGKLLL